MATLSILSAGAAQAVTERVIEEFRRDTGAEVVADFGAVGAMKAKFTAGERADVIILTRAMIDELAQAGRVARDSTFDLGRVGTGVAVRKGAAVPDVSDADAVRRCIDGASRIVCPDPAIATAGKIVMSLLGKLEVSDAVRARLTFFPNGYAAMSWLAASGGDGAVGITQVTEILPNPGVTYAGALPDAFQMKATYTLAVALATSEPALAKDFAGRFASPQARALLSDAGYELG
jgi:molybdate transport system substrate-binding protein